MDEGMSDAASVESPVTPELLRKAASRASMIQSFKNAADSALRNADRMLNDLEKDEALKNEVHRALGDNLTRLQALLKV